MQIKKFILLIVAGLLFSPFAVAKQGDVLGTITDISGKKYDIIDRKTGIKFSNTGNKVVLVEFFGHRCPPCLMSVPHLTKLQNKYKDDLQILAIEVDRYSPNQLKWLKAYMGINYSLFNGYVNSWFIQFIQQGTQWPGSIPFMLLIDRDGTVRETRLGMWEDIDKTVEKMIQTQESNSTTAAKTATKAPAK